ncbi:MAG TPA: hypothetical protein VE909_02820 [Xanthobacteraceae bacterium]|nr:hypothetical protein [Xanthobacteraceae bacterium]
MSSGTKNCVLTVSPRFWRAITLLVRIDMAFAVTGAAALWLWLTWH